MPHNDRGAPGPARQADDVYESLRAGRAAAGGLLQDPAGADHCHVRRYFPAGRPPAGAGGGQHGGHNGIKSIVQELQSQAFPRVKVGVGQKPHPDYDLADWVLSTFSAQEEKALVPVITWAGQAALEIMQHGCQAAANLFNGKTQ